MSTNLKAELKEFARQLDVIARNRIQRGDAKYRPSVVVKVQATDLDAKMFLCSFEQFDKVIEKTQEMTDQQMKVFLARQSHFQYSQIAVFANDERRAVVYSYTQTPLRPVCA